MFIIGILLLAAFGGFVIWMVNSARSTSDDEALRAVRENINRAVVSCYAYEGMYPDSLEYLEENYSLVINKDKYFVYYEKIANNLMPNIIITRHGESIREEASEENAE